MGDAVLCIDGSDVQGERFPQSNLQVRVFNSDFINENVFPVGGGDMPPILVLGAENVEKQKEVEHLKEQYARAQSNLESARSAKQAKRDNLDRFCIDRAKVIKDTLRSSGQNPYNNYDKTNFRDDVKKMIGAGDNATHRLTEVEREELLIKLRATPRPKVEALVYALPDFNAITDDLSKLLTNTVVSAAIEALKDNPKLADWTRQGLALHQDQNAERCLFCEQPLPKDLLAALEAHFNAQYEQFIQRLDKDINELKAKSTVS